MTTSLQRTSLGELGYSALAATSLGELGGEFVPAVTDVHPPGMGPEERLRHKRILQEDEMIMAVILAFLDIKDN